MQARVICPIDWTNVSDYVRFDTIINGSVVSSNSYSPGSIGQLEATVPEYGTVNFIAVIYRDGTDYTNSSGEINVGAAPYQPPVDPLPTPPTLPGMGTPYVAEWVA